MLRFSFLRFLVTLLFSGLLTANIYAEPISVKSPYVGNDNDKYAFEMLQLALSYTKGKYIVSSDSANDKTLARTISDIESGGIDVLWTTTDTEKESILLPVRIPLFKGLFGFRILIINKNNIQKFSNIETFDDLKALSFGQGATWADTKVLEANGLKVVKPMKYPSLMYMVDGGRFDAFPRGVQDPWSEIKRFSSLNLMVEPNIMLVYKMPFYLFVNKNNASLAKDIEQGLNLAIADGSFDQHFYANPAVQEVVKYANMRNRKIFELKNPNLPEKTPIGRAELWLDMSKF